MSELAVKFLKSMVVAILFLNFLFAQKPSENNIGAKNPENLAMSPVITMERTLCYGRCPAYRIEVYSDGLVIYQGKGFVKTTGEVRDTLSAGQLARLNQCFENADYFTLKSRYENQHSCAIRATDHPSVRISFRDSLNYAEFDHYLGCYQSNSDHTHFVRSPADRQLIALEDSVDSIIGTGRWIH